MRIYQHVLENRQEIRLLRFARNDMLFRFAPLSSQAGEAGVVAGRSH
jgi:hypothetical protein